MHGELGLRPHARGLVIFAHGSGSSRSSPRNRAVARALERAGFDTLLVDLLTAHEEAVDTLTAELRFDIALLAQRVARAIEFAREEDSSTAGLPIGLFGASTGAAAALIAASMRPAAVAAVVSRGGRPDLAGKALLHVTAPTLLIVGGEDHPVIALNRNAYAQLTCERQLVIVPGATHLFEEPGALAEVERLAASWFLEHLTRRPEPRQP
jgi:pimeloyl-ACP methyl ester carboxylesterase